MRKTGQLRMRIGIWHAEERLNLDGFFLTHPHIGLGNNLLKPWNDFFCIAQQDGVLLLTLDQITDFSQIDAFLFIDCPDFSHPLVRRVFEVDKPRYLITYKSEVIKPENWLSKTHALFDRVFTWDDQLIEHTKFIKIHHAQNFNDRPVGVPKDGFCTLVASEGSSSHPSELYSERIRAIQWFEANQPEMFDLYGIGWDAASFPSYRGRVDKTLDILQRYKFALCYENTNHFSGYITEKIFDCFKARCLPIYLGAPNIDEYIPPTCFIDRRKFESYEELYAFIAGMSETEYKIHLGDIERFLETVYPYQYSSNSHHYYYCFASEHFVWTVLGQLLRDRGEQLKTNPLVSVVIPTYNYGRFIDKAITSVIAQNMQDLEVIVLDNASTDDTENRVASYLSDKRVRYVRHPSNIGAFNNGQRGIQMALGKYVVVLSSDDFLLPGHLQTLVSALEANTKCVLAYSPCVWVDDDDKAIRVLDHPGHCPNSYCGGRDELSALLVYDCYITLSAAVIRHSALVEVGSTDPRLWSCGDWDLYIRLAMKYGDFAFSKKPSVCYRVHDDQQSHGLYRTILPLTDCMRIIEKVLASDQALRLAPHIPAVRKLLRYRFDAYPREMTLDLVARIESIEKRLVLIQQDAIRAEHHPDTYVRELSQGIWKIQDGSKAIENTSNRLEDKQHTGMTPMVSVIVPTYNRPETLLIALRSILDQTYKDFEIIVVNDAGSDVENVVRFLDKEGRITYIRHGSNRDRAAARNTAIKVARGKYIVYLDDDDLYYPDHLETLVTYLQKNGTKVAYTDAHRAHQAKRDGRYVVTKRELAYSFDFDYDRILVHNFIPILCLMHEKACLDVIGLFDESLTTHEDWDLLIRLSGQFQIAHIKQVTCEFVSRTDGSTTTSSKRPDFRRTMVIILERYLVSAGEKPHVRAAQDRLLQQLRGGTTGVNVGAQPAESQQIAALLQQADEHYKTGDLQRAKETLGQALEILPDNPQVILAIGNIVLRLGDVEGARREFVKATVVRPDYAPAHVDLAAVLLHLGRGAEAEASAGRALQLDAANISALKVVAKVCLDTERYQEAVQAYATILEHTPNDIETLILVGNCYAEVGRLEDAKTFYRRVLQLDPDNTTAAENLTVVNDKASSSNQAHVTGCEASEPKSVQVSIIIPVFNRLDLTRQCLEAVRRNTPVGQCELIVVDNGSSDGTTEFLRREQDAGRLRAILNSKNGGFARACNQGARAAAGTYLLFLNNDTEVQPGWFEPLIAVLDADLTVGAVGSKLLFPSGAIQHAGVIIIDDQKEQRGLFAGHIYYRMPADPSKVNQSMTYQALTAACLLMRRAVFEQIQGFDEEYWNGYEDVDLCFKIQECGWLMVYEPKSVVIHYESQSGPERHRQESRNVERLHRKWLGKIISDFVIQPDGHLTKTGANRVQPYKSPAHSAKGAATDDQAPLSWDEKLASVSSIRGKTASPESVAPDMVTEALRRVEEHLTNENLDAASEVLIEAIARTPNNTDLIVASGHVAWKQGDLEKACLQFVRAATLKPDHVQAHAALAILFLQQSQFAEAEEAARKALTIDNAEITTLKVLAKICLDTERYQEAVQAYATILNHAPDDIDTLILVGNCYAESGRIEQARSFYRKVLMLEPGNAVAAENLAEIDRLVSASDETTPEPMAHAATKSRPSVSIVVVTYNSAATIRACLDSVLKESRPATDLIVIDNASIDETQAILNTTYRDRAAVILNADNVGFSAACNQGIRASSGEYVVLLNPDTVVTHGWLERLISHIGPDVGAVGPVSDYAADEQNIDRHLPEGAPRRMGLGEVSDLLARVNSGKGAETKLLIGFCLMVPRKVFDDVGLLDEELFLGNDDLDLSWRLRLKGYKLLVATDTFVHHEGQVSFKSEAETKTSRLVQESTDRLYAKLEAHYGVGHVPSPLELWGITWFKPTKTPRTPPPAPLTSIIILTHNGIEHTEKCLASIETHTPEPHELIIVDNGSTDGTLDYLRDHISAHDNIRVVANRTNRGFAAGNNQGLALARGEYVLLLNNDTIVTQGWLQRMLQVFKAHPDVGVVGPMSNYVSGPQLVRDVSYKGLEGLETFAVEWAQGHDGQSAEATRVVGFCLLTRKEVITRIGGLDEQFGSGNFEDDDFCIRAFQVGFRARIALDVFIHHTGSQTFKAAKIDYRQSLMRNWELFKAKWGIPAGAPYEKGYRFPPQSASDVPLLVPLPDVSTDHWGEVEGRWWQEPRRELSESQHTVAEEAQCRAVIVPNGHGIAPLWPSLIQHASHPLTITIVPSIGNGNGGEPLYRPACPEGWQIGTADVPAVRLLNRLLQSAADDPVILLSGDLVLTPGWLKRLLAAIQCDQKPAAVGPTSNHGAAAQRVKADYKGTGKALRQFALRRAHRYGKQLVVTDNLAPSSIVFNPAVCRAIGPLREDLGLTASLTDYFTRITQAGHTVAVALDAYVHCPEKRVSHQRSALKAGVQAED